VAEMAAILHHESWQRPLRPFFFCTPSKWRFINIYFKFNILKLELADQSRKKFQKEKAKIRFNWLVLGAACHINPCWPLSAPTSVHILKSAKKSLGFSPFCVIFLSTFMERCLGASHCHLVSCEQLPTATSTHPWPHSHPHPPSSFFHTTQLGHFIIMLILL